MVRSFLVHLSLGVSAVFCPDVAQGQIAFGIVQQNGVVSGGSLSIGGAVNPGHTGVTMGVNFGTNNLIGVNQFNVPAGNGNPGFATNTRRPPSLHQFLQATNSFDADRNQLLNERELTNVAVALIAEIRQRTGVHKSRPVVASAPADDEAGEDAESPLDKETKRLATSFVARCMQFDRDKDRALNKDETRRMAQVFIRSLG